MVFLYNLEKYWMLLHVAVVVNFEKCATTEIKAQVPIVYGLRGECCMNDYDYSSLMEEESYY